MWPLTLFCVLAYAALAHGGDTLYNILATRHVNGGGDACALPKANYDVQYPFALGSIDELSYLKFRPGKKIFKNDIRRRGVMAQK